MARNRSGESYSQRISAARRKAVIHCADFFDRSGVEYDCLKTVERIVEPELQAIAEQAEYAPYNVASPNNLRRVLDEVHNRWKQRNAATLDGQR
jgi:hypothetical protein